MSGIRATFSALAMLAACGLAAVALPAPALAGPDCTCRHSGGDVHEGQTACIKGPNGMTMARCEKVLNNTSWRMLDQPCPYTALPAQQTQTAANAPKTLSAMSMALLRPVLQD